MTGKLLVKQGGRLLTDLATSVPSNGIISVGSDSSSTIRLENGSAAPEQFVIACDGGRLTLLARAEGTSINQEAVAAGSLRDIHPGDAISAGDYEFVNVSEEQAASMIEEALRTVNDSGSAIPEPDLPLPREDRPLTFEGGLSEVLSNLRAEERFYFQIENGSGDPQRVYVDKEEMWLGWTPKGKCVMSIDTTDIATPRAQIRKDWSGVVVYPLQQRGVWLDSQFLSKPHRLKNEDVFSLLASDGKRVAPDVQIRFHEPTALLVLNSILPKELPPPVSIENLEEPAQISTAVAQASPKPPAKKFLLFGYFSIGEVLILTFGTIVTAALTFLILVLF